jgi:hypothetical protein
LSEKSFPLWMAVALSIAWIVGTAIDRGGGIPEHHPVLARLADNLIIWILGGGFLATWNKWKAS